MNYSPSARQVHEHWIGLQTSEIRFRRSCSNSQMFRVEDTRLRESRKKCDACDQNPTSSNAGVPKEFSYANTMP